MSFVPVIEYIAGLVVFGFIYWLLDGILNIFKGLGVEDSTTYSVYPLLTYIWFGLVVVYLVFGGIWLVRRYNEADMQGGY